MIAFLAGVIVGTNVGLFVFALISARHEQPLPVVELEDDDDTYTFV